ncbi:MAG: nucleotide sugar dehydrogenase [Planctomycetota bacterium]|nr:nucleotide sugar dehydrogenase [Planctomycetota bacterium]
MERIAVVGLGYVGLPLALALAKKFPGSVGFDCNPDKVARLRAGQDPTGEGNGSALAETTLALSADPAVLKDRTFIIVCVPTPVDANKRPDLEPLRLASETIGAALAKGAAVVFESTVYPGVTEEFCGPILEKASGLARGKDFTLGYSPERINPGDKEHTLEHVVKVVAGEDAATLDRVAAVYGAVVAAGVYRAPSIKVAEAAKVIENTQRDLNIALMNELAVIFDRLGIATRDVLAAAGTKWNFLKFSPGLVGGHCIGVDPYYLTAKAEEVGYQPQVILAGRRINDRMGAFVARKTLELLGARGVAPAQARVAILGLTFKENVHDLRNSRVPDIVAELRAAGVEPLIHEPLAAPEDARHEYGLALSDWADLTNLDALVLAVPHRAYLEKGAPAVAGLLKPGGVLVDVKSALDSAAVGANVVYWSL